ncbi:MAG: hypothetical protein HC904_13430 [Blastochloris sp.]|nr:hypothetical protein [Blastochloris sp.]
MAEIDKIEAELKPLRVRATRESEVIAARKEADEALRRYYEVLRLKMAQLDPKQKKKIERQVQLRKEIYGGSAGSRAEDLMTKAAEEKSKKVSEVKSAP